MNKNYVEIDILTEFYDKDAKMRSYLYKVGDKFPTLMQLKARTKKFYEKQGLIKEMKAFLKMYVGYTRKEVKEFDE